MLGGIGLAGAAGRKSLIWLIKWLKGSPAKSAQLEGDEVVYERSDGQKESVPIEVHELYQVASMRVNLYQVLKPLENNGVDVFEAHSNGEKTQEVTQDDLDYFRRASQQEDLVSSVLQTNLPLQIIAPSFKEGTKWRMNTGGGNIYVEVADEFFMQRINEGERFGKGDILLVDMRTTTTLDAGKLKAQYVVEHVHEHRRISQPRLFDDNGSDMSAGG